MAIPASIEARLFYRCAFQRYEDAQILLRADHTTGAVYLAGYGIECILKALLLSAVPLVARTAMLNSFRGTRAHDYEWLRTPYLQNGGSRYPRKITEAFTLVNDWSTDMRYLPRTLKAEEAEGFLAAAENIIHWADGRL
ncbi:MAG: HEPN domain-containing protein [Isosphaeraceae bacterium]|nr:HEPN domain-containing protein [Isosphaeraceae bacterium]